MSNSRSDAGTAAVSPFTQILERLAAAVDEVQPLAIRGRVIEVTGTIIRAVVPGASIGELCLLVSADSRADSGHQGDAADSAGAAEDAAEGAADAPLRAEVVGIDGTQALLTPMGELYGLSASTEVIPTGRMHMVPVGPALLGRVVDGLGAPMDRDTKGPLMTTELVPVDRDAPAPLSRRIIDTPLPLGLRAIDGMLTCGEGQRMGIFAAAGGGKSTLLAMLVKGARVDVTVVALIGERGREVREFIEHDLGPEGTARSVLVVATSDRPSMERAKAANVATAIAEYFRDQGNRVLLLMDSVTRFARAQREIGLAAGEPPTRRGFPPSVFATLPRLMERAGQSDKGFITALYTVLVEGDDMTEPVADETRSILDGHIILSRKLAAENHYPAIDILASVSRVMNAIVSPEQRRAAGRVRELLAKRDEVELLVKIGEYKEGSDPLADEALARIDAINAFLCQRMDEHTGFDEAVSQLSRLV